MMPLPLPHEIRTARLHLRLPDARDMAPFAAYCADAQRRRFTGGPLERYKAHEKLAAMIGQWNLMGFGRYAIAESAEAPGIGHVGLLAFEEGLAPEMTWTLWRPEAEGKGYATEAARAVLRCLDGARVEAHVHPENTGSVALAARLGGSIAPDARSYWRDDVDVWHLPCGASRMIEEATHV